MSSDILGFESRLYPTTRLKSGSRITDYGRAVRLNADALFHSLFPPGVPKKLGILRGAEFGECG